MSYSIVVITPPATEPVSLANVKDALGLSSGSYRDNVTVSQSIAPGSHPIAAADSLLGASVDTLGSQVLLAFEWAGFGQGSTVSVTVQGNQDNGAAWTAVPAGDLEGGLFGQVTTATANATFERGYLGGKRYLRVVSTVAGAAGSFGVSIHTNAGQTADDVLLGSLITQARELAEKHDGRTFVTTTFDLYLDGWPDGDYLELPTVPLLAMPAPIVHYYDADDTEYTMTATDYSVRVADQFRPRIHLKSGKAWPSTSLREYEPVIVHLSAGYGLAADVPEYVRQNIIAATAYAYLHRGDPAAMSIGEYVADVCSWPDRMGIV